MSPKFKIQNLKSLIFLLLFLFAQNVYSQTFEDGYYRLTTQWLGDVKSLDVVNDGTNNKVHLTNTANASGQNWKITALGNGYYRLTTQWLGAGKSLDVVNDGINDKLQLAGTSNASGQFWKIAPVGNGYYRLTTRWLGDVKSLDVVNDGANNKLKLAETGDFSGQYWKITKISSARPVTETVDQAATTKPATKTMVMFGFKLIVNESIANDSATQDALAILSNNLKEISRLLTPEQLVKLKKVPIWIQYKRISDKAMWYHPNRDWLVGNGYPAEMEKSVEINNVRNFIDWQGDQPYMTMHELAHAYEDLYLEEMQNEIAAAYNSAVASKKYESVPYIRGGKQRAYALNNKTEYFAELTEAYLGKNDFYPFNREDLKEFDPKGYKLMQEAWK